MYWLRTSRHMPRLPGSRVHAAPPFRPGLPACPPATPNAGSAPHSPVYNARRARTANVPMLCLCMGTDAILRRASGRRCLRGGDAGSLPPWARAEVPMWGTLLHQEGQRVLLHGLQDHRPPRTCPRPH